MNFQQQLQAYQARVNDELLLVLPKIDLAPIQLHEAMHYGVFNGGKRLRPSLVYAVGKLLNLAETALDPIACAVEFVHCYSLIHDDLPCMDNDATRRGKPSCHIEFGEATALLAGNALLTLAYQVLLTAISLNPEQRIALLSQLTHAVGDSGLLAGQALEFETTPSQTMTMLSDIHQRKTGALFKAAILMPFQCLRTGDLQLLHTLEEFANYFGQAYQLRDDLDDLTKKPQETQHNLAHLLGSSTAQQLLDELCLKSKESLALFGQEAHFLHELIEYLTAS